MKKCISCGADLDDTMKFCPRCGTLLNPYEQSTPVNFPPQPPIFPPQPPLIPQQPRNNSLAIAGFVVSLASLAFCGFPAIIGLILSIIALNQIKNTGESGKGFAVAGIVIGAAEIFLILLLIFVAICTSCTSGAHYYYNNSFT
ncbi:MAG: DUF4190 domain-containing protein [Bacillota bacterium]|nr:DUF4190 domain-containing protein [Bacillota bacterium]